MWKNIVKYVEEVSVMSVEVVVMNIDGCNY